MFELIEREGPAQEDPAIGLRKVILWIEHAHEPQFRLKGPKPLHKRWPLTGWFDVVYKDVDSNSLSQFECFQRIRRHQHAVTESA